MDSNNTQVDLLGAHLERSQVDRLIETYGKCFTANKIEVQFSCAPRYPPLVLVLTEFIPPPEEKSPLKIMHNQGPAIEPHSPARLALPSIETNLRRKCLEHIQAMVRYHLDNDQVFPRKYSSQVSTRTFAAVCKYHKMISSCGNVWCYIYCFRFLC